MDNSNPEEREVDVLFDLVKHKYSDHLSSNDLDDVRNVVKGIIDAAKEIRSVKLKNSDEPGVVFRPFLKEG